MPQHKHAIDVTLLRNWMTDKGSNQAGLARATGISPSHLVKILRDGRAAEGLILRLQQVVVGKLVVPEPIGADPTYSPNPSIRDWRKKAAPGKPEKSSTD